MQQTKGIFMSGLSAAIGAVILNVVFLYLSWNVFDIHPRVTMGTSDVLTDLGMLQVVIATLIPGIVATALYWMLARFTFWPNLIFGITSFVVLVLSFFGPFMLPVTGAEQLVLVMLHILPALAITPTLIIAGLCACDCCDEDCDDDCDVDYCDDEDCEECVIICEECGSEIGADDDSENCDDDCDCEDMEACGCGCDGVCECGEDYDCAENCACQDDDHECVCEKKGTDECCGQGCCKTDK